jgi:hypothetical protein
VKIFHGCGDTTGFGDGNVPYPVEIPGLVVGDPYDFVDVIVVFTVFGFDSVVPEFVATFQDYLQEVVSFGAYVDLLIYAGFDGAFVFSSCGRSCVCFSELLLP